MTDTFHAFAELSESPNFFDVPSNLPFSRNIQPDFLKKRKSNKQLAEITVMPTVALQG
jgi:hypothetical protein